MKKGIAVFDLHYPEHNKILWNNILKFAKDFKPDYFLFGGDNLDMSPVSHWLLEGGQFRKLEGKRLINDYKGFVKEIKEPLENILPDSCKKIWLEGNHENWAEQAIDKNPQYEGLIEIENYIDLKYWSQIPYNGIHKIGKMYFTHGMYTNQYHSAKTVNIVEKNIFYGHTHDHQTHTKITMVGNEPHIGVSVPCTCDLNPQYMRNKPNKWLNGFLIWYMKDNGDFNHYIIIANKGHFIYNGIQY